MTREEYICQVNLEAGMISKRLPIPTTSTVTKMLRFIERDGKRILQQGWRVKTFDSDSVACIGLRLEWRDVPIERDT